MRQRRELALAALVLPVLAVLCLALVTTLIGGAGAGFAHTGAIVSGLLPPAPFGTRAGHHALEGAILVTAVCMLLGLVMGWMLGRLPFAWAVVARAMLLYPALTVVIAWLLGRCLQLTDSEPTAASISASAAIPPWAGPRAVLIALLAPWFAIWLAQAWRRLDPTTLRAAESLGVDPLRRAAHLVVPQLARPLAIAATLTFLAAIVVLAMRARPASEVVDGAAIDSLSAVLAAIPLTVQALWRLSVQRWAV